MKKIRALFICAVFPLFLLSSCGSSRPSCCDILKSVCSRDAGSTAIYDLSEGAVSVSDDNFLTSLFFSPDAKGLRPDLSDGAILLSKRGDGFEIILLCPAHPSDKEGIRRLLEGRLQNLQSAQVRRYMSENYENYIEKAGVYEVGDLICLLSTDDNSSLVESIKAVLK